MRVSVHGKKLSIKRHCEETVGLAMTLGEQIFIIIRKFARV